MCYRLLLEKRANGRSKYGARIIKITIEWTKLIWTARIRPASSFLNFSVFLPCIHWKLYIDWWGLPLTLNMLPSLTNDQRDKNSGKLENKIRSTPLYSYRMRRFWSLNNWFKSCCPSTTNFCGIILCRWTLIGERAFSGVRIVEPVNIS